MKNDSADSFSEKFGASSLVEKISASCRFCYEWQVNLLFHAQALRGAIRMSLADNTYPS